jgi:hypothetical protein
VKKQYHRHGHAKGPGKITREYTAWAKMKHRCLNSHNNRFKYYGGKGITIAERWAFNFPNFLADMGRCPSGRSLGRIDNDKSYGPGNCRWETRTQQANNKSNNRKLTVRGVTKNIAQWARFSGTSPSMIRGRLKRNWSPELAIFSPTKRPDLTYGK